MQDSELEEAEAHGDFLDTIPESIARPWVRLSQSLGLPPILTYATTVLWNWALIDESKPISLNNVRILESFTGTESERHFFLTSLLIEIRGVEALKLMRQSLDEIFCGDELGARRFTSYLNRLAAVIKDLTQLLAQVRDSCVPAEFYFDIRPWFRGGDAALEGRGWHFEGVDASSIRRQLGGPSAGQSSLIHALDVFLDVDHTRTKERVRERVQRPEDMPSSDATFMERMAFYMPKHHRHFLMHLRSLSFEEEGTSRDMPQSGNDNDAVSMSTRQHPVRAYVLSRKDFDLDLVAAYDATLAALKALRDEHMRIAALYIISQARKAKPQRAAAVTPTVAESHLPTLKEPEFRGTGGTDLVLFLRDCRTNTTDAMIA